MSGRNWVINRNKENFLLFNSIALSPICHLPTGVRSALSCRNDKPMSFVQSGGKPSVWHAFLLAASISMFINIIFSVRDRLTDERIQSSFRFRSCFAIHSCARFRWVALLRKVNFISLQKLPTEVCTNDELPPTILK